MAAILLLGCAAHVAQPNVDARLLAARGIDRRDEAGNADLRAALQQAPDDDMIRMSLVNELLRGPLRSQPDRTDAGELREIIAAWPARSPDNAMVWYLAAWQALADGNAVASQAALATGNAAPRCESYARERFLVLREANERGGDSRVAASRDALGLLDPMSAYRAIDETCKALDAGSDDKARRACHAAGQRIEANSQNNLEALVGLLIQDRAARGSGWTDESALTAHVDARRTELGELANQLNARTLSDADVQRYFDLIASGSEETAMRTIVSAAPPPTTASDR